MNQIPSPSRKRLVTLSQILSQLEENSKITSVEISSRTGWSEATIRRDISLLKLHSGKSNGYSVGELRESIRERLNLSAPELRKCCVVGLGKLGAALLENADFSGSPFMIAAGFDSSTNRIELLESTIPLFSTSDLEGEIGEMKIDYAILCVADRDAQKIAERLSAAGIKGIVNYTNTILKLPAGLEVENVSMAFALSNLASKAK